MCAVFMLVPLAFAAKYVNVMLFYFIFRAICLCCSQPVYLKIKIRAQLTNVVDGGGGGGDVDASAIATIPIRKRDSGSILTLFIYNTFMFCVSIIRIHSLARVAWFIFVLSPIST